VAELAAQYEIHPTMINIWKRQLMEGASDLFESQQHQGERDQDAQVQIDELYR
jgi:transposase-like protein